MLTLKTIKEKVYWLISLTVVFAILSTLFLGTPLAELFASQDVRAGFFVLVMVLIGIAIIIHGWRLKPGKTEFLIWMGMAGVFIMFFLRLGMPERSHLMEYSVLAIFIHKALLERYIDSGKKLKPALLAIVMASCVGLLDESLQLFIPDRVFDWEDVIFNTNAILFTIGAHTILQWARKKWGK